MQVTKPGYRSYSPEVIAMINLPVAAILKSKKYRKTKKKTRAAVLKKGLNAAIQITGKKRKKKMRKKAINPKDLPAADEKNT